jgi:hypothetical protein
MMLQSCVALLHPLGSRGPAHDVSLVRAESQDRTLLIRHVGQTGGQMHLDGRPQPMVLQVVQPLDQRYSTLAPLGGGEERQRQCRCIAPMAEPGQQVDRPTRPR